MKKVHSCVQFLWNSRGGGLDDKPSTSGRSTPPQIHRATRRTGLHVRNKGDNDHENPQRDETIPLHLLSHSESTPCNLNEYLRDHPQLAKRAQSLQRLTSITPITTMHRKVLNVLQSEVAHATSAQVDWLLSGDATTCHVVGLRSSSSSSSRNSVALTSLAHLDECHLPSLDAIVQEHLHHHHNRHHRYYPRKEEDEDDFGYFLDAVEEHDEKEEKEEEQVWKAPFPASSPTESRQFPGFEMPCRPPATTKNDQRDKNKIQMDLHLVGGCDDPTSYQLSRDLLEAWAALADRYTSQLQIHLVTAAISSLNVSSGGGGGGYDPLLSRGMGIDCHTGQVFGLQSIAAELQGPAIEIRQARLWARAVNQKPNGSDNGENRLVVIHTPPDSSELWIAPFDYQPQPHLETLLHMPNDALKQVTSTSPNLEGEHFCTGVRRTLSWLQLVPSEGVFGKHPRALRYSRSAGHQWEPHDEPTRRALQSSHRHFSPTTATSSKHHDHET